MSLLNKASLIQIPSGYKDGVLYSAKPINRDGDFTFSRGSNLAATRVNSEGLIEKGRENLLLQSNAFDTWINSNTTETSGQSGYDGTNDAWLLEKSAASGFLWKSFSGSGVYSLSLYAKAGTLNSVFVLILASGGNGDGYFNLSTGTVGTFRNNAFDAKIEDIGGGWYRCSLIGSYTSISQVRIYPANDESLADTSGSIYIQDAQLEAGLVATDYIETGATTAQAGILEDMPRLDYSGGASCPSLLLEPTRTNLLPHSEYISSSVGWIITDFGTGVGDPVVTLNAAMSPEGKMNACQIDFQSCTGAQQNAVAYTVTGLNVGDMITHSVYLKAPVDCTLIIRDASVFNEDPINVTTEWQRFDITSAAGYTYSQFKIGLRPSQGSQADACSVYMYAPQMEIGSYPTSYIPTYGASVTRGGDLSSVTGVSDLIGQTEGTLFVDVDFNGLNASISQTPIFVRTAGSNTGYAFINFYQGKVNCALRVAGSTLFDSFQTDVLSAGRYKIAFAYKSGDIAIYVNGVQEETRTNTFGTTSYADVHLGGVSGNQLGDGHKQALLFKTRLSNDELATLTTL